MSDIKNREVFAVQDVAANCYLTKSPYHPDQNYPEYPFAGCLSPKTNWAYRLVRELFRNMGFDEENYGTTEWNPLTSFVKPGYTVLLKPNLVCHKNFCERIGLHDKLGLVTHGSIIRAIADYVYIALRGRGRIIVGDSPIQGADWDKLVELEGFEGLRSFFAANGMNFDFVDFRIVRAKLNNSNYVASQEGFEEFRNEGKKTYFSKRNGLEYVEVDLGTKSLFSSFSDEDRRFGISDYDFKYLRITHNSVKNCYLFPKLVFEADCFINIAKLKSHSKAGITCAMKNLVGINGHKDYLPHFRVGSPLQGGDEYPQNDLLTRIYWLLWHQEWKENHGLRKGFLRFGARGVGVLLKRSEKFKGSGGWYGNDTLWRTVLDLNRAFFYFNPKISGLDLSIKRNYLCVVDGIVGGNKESPLCPTDFVSSTVLGAINPVALDVVACELMGFDHRRIKQLVHAFDVSEFPLARFKPEEIRIHINHDLLDIEKLRSSEYIRHFEPSEGWKEYFDESTT